MSPLLTRRQTLQSLATVAVFSSGLGGMALSLAGCGGSGGDGGGSSNPGGGNITLRTRTVKTKVVLPAGTSVAPDALRVTTAGGSATPNATGEVEVAILNDGPQFTEVRDSGGNLVLAGFVSPGQTTLDAASTAQVIATFGLGVAAITGEARPKVIASLGKAAGFTDLVAEVERGLKANGRTAFGDPAIGARLDAMFAAAGGGTRAAHARRGSTRGTIVEPTTNPSGIAVDSSVDGELRLKNVRLRRAIAWLDPISHQVDRGAGITTVPAEKSTKPDDPIKIDPPKRFGGTIGTLKDVIENAISDAPLPYTPVDVGPFPIPAIVPSVAGCLSTEYKLSIVGPGASEGDLAKVGALRQPQISRVFFDGFLLDYFLPFFTTIVIPLQSDEIDGFLKFSNGNAILGDAVNTVFSTAPAVGKLMSEGNYYDAVIALRDAGLLSGTFLPLMADLFVAFVQSYGSDKLAGNTDKYLKTAGGIFETIGALDKGLSIAEAFVVARDFDFSNRGDVLTITSTGGKVSLGASRPILPANASSNIRAIIQDKNPDAVYKYEWSVSAGFRLNDSFGKNTDQSPNGVLTTSQENVAIIAKDLKPGTASVRCKVTRIDGPTDVPVSEGKGDILFTATFSVGAAQTRISKGGSTTLTAAYGGTEETEWVYAITSGTGSLSSSGRTKSKTVTLKAGDVAGPIGVTAECFVKAEGEFYSIGTTGAVVTVDTRVETSNVSGKTVSGVLVIPPGGVFGDPNLTTYEGAAVRVVEIARRPGATKYEVFRNGSRLSNNPPVVSPENPWWGQFKPADVIWARVAYSTGSTTVTYDSARAGTDASEASAYLSGEYGAETYELRITY